MDTPIIVMLRSAAFAAFSIITVIVIVILTIVLAWAIIFGVILGKRVVWVLSLLIHVWLYLIHHSLNLIWMQVASWLTWSASKQLWVATLNHPVVRIRPLRVMWLKVLKVFIFLIVCHICAQIELLNQTYVLDGTSFQIIIILWIRLTRLQQ